MTHYASKSVQDVTSRSVWEVRKSQRDSYRKDNVAVDYTVAATDTLLFGYNLLPGPSIYEQKRDLSLVFSENMPNFTDILQKFHRPRS